MKTVTIFGLLLSCLTITLAGYADDKADSSSIREQQSRQQAPSSLGLVNSKSSNQESNDNAIKDQFNIEPQYQSCHTAVHGVLNKNYVFEGHIPVKFIQQFLSNPLADATGLAVPAMPLGSPGMEVAQRFTSYKIYQLNTDGEPTVFATIARMEEQY